MGKEERRGFNNGCCEPIQYKDLDFIEMLMLQKWGKQTKLTHIYPPTHTHMRSFISLWNR